jgi:hypothetical protein
VEAAAESLLRRDLESCADRASQPRKADHPACASDSMLELPPGAARDGGDIQISWECGSGNGCLQTYTPLS